MLVLYDTVLGMPIPGTWYVVSYGYIPLSGIIDAVGISLRIPKVNHISVQIGTWYTIKTKSSDERAARPLVSSQMRHACEARAGFRYPAQTRVPTRCKLGRWARSRQVLLVVYVLQPHSVVPCTMHCCCDVCLMCHTTKNESVRSAGRFALTSDQQQQCCSIMMHPSGHHAAGRQRRSHAPIPSRQPRSVCTSTWSLSRVQYVCQCCVPSLRVTWYAR